MSVLADALADTRQDGHPALLIGGEAGAAKSRLLAEFQATAPDARVLAGGCLAMGGDAIAAELFISAKTASVHVSNILAKLGAATRTEAAAMAHHRGLAGI
jgi:hypothetical protein